jgi:hypothetical protein
MPRAGPHPTRDHSTFAGIESVATDVAAKKVVVQTSGSPTAEEILAALKKWGDASGKSVELATT